MSGPLQDASERLGPDDMATRREEEFLSAAMRVQAARAAVAQARHRPGICSNCGSVCLPQAVYCDADCRADDERRCKVLARQGRGHSLGQ